MFSNKKCQWVVAALTIIVATGNLHAESVRNGKRTTSGPYNSAAISTTKTQTTSFSPTYTGMVDLRTGYFSKSGKSDMENAVELGAKLTPSVSISYFQAFNAALYNSPDTTNGQNVLLDAGFIRSKINDVWQSEDKQTSFSLEQRLYLSNSFFQKDINMISVFRNYFKLSHRLNNSVKLTLMEVPILFVNGSSGVKDSANPFFENRVILAGDISLTKKLSLSLPVFFHQTRFFNYKEGAANNDRWAYVLWVNPEIDYQIDENFMVGFAYSNWSNLLASDLSKTNFANGFEDGVYQAIMTFTF